MAYSAQIVVTGIGTVDFAVAPTDRGRVPTGRETLLEELVADGIDDFRWRRRSYRYIKFKMMTTADGPSWAFGKYDAETYENMTGEYGTLTVTAGSITETWRRVKILTCKSSLHAGSLVGFGADASSAYVLDATWELIITEDAT